MYDQRRGSSGGEPTQPGLERGGYYHNTMGRVVFADDDPAADEAKAGTLWARLDELAAGYV